MESHPKISELLIETGAFRDLDLPVILTSGELGIYYINTEKLCQDGGEFEKYGDDSQAMIQHAVKMTKEHPTFEEVIDVLSKRVQEIFASMQPLEHPLSPIVISGGQRRDWLFSGPVANKLDAMHISLYKQTENKDKIELFYSDGRIEKEVDSLYPLHVIHISDLLTEASSCYRIEDGIKKGWIPMLRNKKADVRNLVSVVTRQQGGEERLKNIGINAEAFVAIDENFVKTYSKNPERAVSYMQNPRAWSENYLRENGALALIETFNPKSGKLDRAKKFLDRYGDVLAEADRWNELDKEVNKRYGVHLGQISGDID